MWIISRMKVSGGLARINDNVDYGIYLGYKKCENKFETPAYYNSYNLLVQNELFE